MNSLNPATRTSRLGRRTATVAAAALPLLTGLVAAPAASAAPIGSAATVTQCPYTAHDLRNIPVVEKQIGQRLDCALVFSDNMDTWDQWEKPWFAYSPIAEYQWDDWARPDGGNHTLVMSFNLVPKNMPSDWRTRGANGEYDTHIRRLAENLVAKGLGNEVIRLGSEANGTWRPDHIGNNTTEFREWARYWNHYVKVMRSVPGAHFTFDWTVNAGYRAIPFDQYYPGDDVVDVIGIDQYDSLVTPRTSNRWNDIANQKGGLNELGAFARAHGKPISLPEVGLVSKSNYGAGDDPAYVAGLASFVAANKVASIGYFNKNVGGTLRLEEVPKSAAKWRASFGNGDGLTSIVRSKLGSTSTASTASGPVVTAKKPTKKAPTKSATATTTATRPRVPAMSVTVKRSVPNRWTARVR